MERIIEQTLGNVGEVSFKQAQIESFEDCLISNDEYQDDDIRVSFDTEKYRLEPTVEYAKYLEFTHEYYKNHRDFFVIIKETLEKTFDDKTDHIRIYHTDHCSFIHDDSANKNVGRFYRLHNGDCILELFGLSQNYSNYGNLKMNGHYKKILDAIVPLEINIHLLTVAISLDAFFVDYNRSVVIYGNPPTTESALKKHIEDISEQNKGPKSSINGFKTHHVVIPKKEKRIINSIFKDKNIKKEADVIKYTLNYKNIKEEAVVIKSILKGKKVKNETDIIKSILKNEKIRNDSSIIKSILNDENIKKGTKIIKSIKFILKDEINKSKQNSDYSFFRYVRPPDDGFGGMVNYQICNGEKIKPRKRKTQNRRRKQIEKQPRYHKKESEATHLMVNIKDRKTNKKIDKLIKNKKVSKSVFHDPESEIYISSSKGGIIVISYDKPDEYGSHLRVEFKLNKPGIKREPNKKQEEESNSNEILPVGIVAQIRYVNQKIKESKLNKTPPSEDQLREKPQNNEKELDRLERLDMRNPQSYLNLKAVIDEIINSLRVLVLNDPKDRGKFLRHYKRQINKIRAEPYVSEKFGEFIQARKGDADKEIKNIKSIFLK
jgi:hypothetical protein